MRRSISPIILAGALLLAASLASPVHATEPITVAITYFDNHATDPELAPLGKGLADMLITDLSGVGALRIVERSRLNEILGELTLSGSAFVDPKTAQKLGKGLAAQYILTGSYLLNGDAFRIDARLIDVETGAVRAGEKVEGTRADFFAMEKELVELLVGSLGLKLPFNEKAALRKNATESFDAWYQYSKGLHALDSGDKAEARRLFAKALEADPRYQAAKTARGRIKVIVARHHEARRREADALLKELDPDAPDFGQKVDQALVKLTGRDAASIAKKVALLRWLVENGYTPSMPGFSRASTELMSLFASFSTDPDTMKLLPGLCEYVLRWYPNDQMAPQICDTYIEVIEQLEKHDPAAFRKSFQETLAKPSRSFAGYAANYQAIRELFELCGKMANKKPPTANKTP